MATETRVLVVDDSHDAAELAAERLRGGLDDASVDVVTDTTAATARLDDRDYDAVVSDYHMAGGDGLAFLERVRERYGDLPFVIYTGTGSEAIASRAIGAGVTDYILKHDRDAGRRLVTSVRAAVARRRTRAELDEQRGGRELLLDQALVGVVVIQNGLFRYANEQFVRILGYEPGEVAGQLGPEDIVDPADLPMVREKIRQRIDGERESLQYSFTAVRKNGERRRVEAFGEAIDYEGEPAVLGLLLPESTDRRRQRGLAALGDATQELMAAMDRERVHEIAVDCTRSVLEREFGAIYQRDGEAFEPVATTAAFDAFSGGTPPSLPADGWLGEGSSGGGTKRVGEGDPLGVGLESVLAVPLGQHQVFVAGSVEPNAFDEGSEDLAEQLAGNIESALARTRYEEQLFGLNEAGEGFVRATHPELVAELAVRTARDVLGIEFATVYVRETDVEGPYLRPVASTDERRALDADVPELRPGESLTWDAYESDELRRYGDISTEPGHLSTTQFRSVLALPLGGHGVLTGVAPEPDAFDDIDATLGRVLAATVTATLDRTDHDQRLEALYESTQQMMAARTPEAVAEAAIATARDVLGHELCGLHVPEGDQLVPVASTEALETLVGEVPPLPRVGSLAGEAFESGELRRLEDGGTLANPETAIRSELLLPLGSEGVLIVSSTAEDAFDRTDVQLAELFAAGVRAAMERADREATVRRQNERLEEFASVVSHDLRNPLSVAMGRLEMSMESTDDPNLPIVERSLDRMAALIEDVLALAKEGQTVGEPEPVALAPLARDVWRAQDAPDAELQGVDDLPTVDGDPGRLRQLFENLFGNALRHAGPDVTVTVGPDDSGFFVADDGPGIPPDKREQVLESGYTTNREGTGFGLAIVRSIAGAHGWSVAVTESDSGGARFEFEW